MMAKISDKMGVFVLMSHLLITLVVLGIYGYTLASGQADETLKTVLTVIIGYWFGAMGKDMIKKPNSNNDSNNNNNNQSKLGA